ncbi:MAG: DUF559 domain-containing protein [Pseudonocardiaceae bacterium]
MRAAVLWAGEDAVAHGVSATWWHDLGPALPAMVEVTVRRGRNPGKQLGVSVRRRDLSYPDLVAVRDLWVTDLPLTVLEAAIALGPEGSELLDRSLQRRVKFPAVCRAQCRNHGRRGSAQAAQLLAVAADRAASLAERVLVRLLRAAGITEWKLGYPVLGYVVDLAFPAQRVAIEVDGWAWHVTADRFVDDRRRQNALVTTTGQSCASPGTTWSLVPTVSSRRSAQPSRIAIMVSMQDDAGGLLISVAPGTQNRAGRARGSVGSGRAAPGLRREGGRARAMNGSILGGSHGKESTYRTLARRDGLLTRGHG